MSSDPVLQPGQLSPDGLWRWDGTQWVPATPGVSAIPAPPRSRSWIWWLVGGCAVLLVLAVIAIGFGIYSLVNGFQHGAFNCLPSDFPSYPGASVVSENTQLGTGMSPGDNKRCTIVLDSNDNVDTVTSFYQQNLATGDWTIPTAHPPQGEFSFTRISRPQTRGTVIVVVHGQHTEIDIQLDS
jgi:hypothetical protein